MNTHDELTDDEVLAAVAESVSAIPLAEPPAEAAIMSRGRARRRRHLAGLGMTAAVGATAVALSLAGVFSGPTAPAGSSATIRTAAFTLGRNANGTVTLRLTQGQVFDPAALQHALRQAGIPALVKTGTYCTSNPAPPSPHSTGVLSVQLPDGTPVGISTPGHAQPVPADALTVINPAAMPTGTELFFDYLPSGHELISGLIYTGSHTCHSGLPAAGPSTP